MVHKRDDFTKPEDENKNSKVDEFTAKKPDTLFLYFTVYTAISMMLTGGTTLVWQSPAIIKFQSNDSQVNPLEKPIQPIEVSMLIGIPSLLSIIGGVFIPKISDLIGRKMALHFLGLAILLSLIGIAFSDKLYLFIIFVTVCNTIFSGFWSLVPIYLMEISEDHNRAKFGCCMSMFMPLGQLYCYIVGSAFSIRDFTLLNAVPLFPFLMLFFFAPESPVYSLSKGKERECEETLKKLRSNKTKKEIEKDLEKIRVSLAVQTGNKNTLNAIFKTKEGRLGLLLALLPMVVQFLSGVPTVMGLMAPIFNETGTLSGNTIAIIVGVIKVISYFLTSLVVERTGRKPLFLISSIGAGLAVSVLGLYFYLQHINSPVLEHLRFIPLFGVAAYIILYSVGLGPIPVAVVSEMFPSDIRPTAVGFVTSIAGIVISLTSFAFPLLVECIGTHWCMWIFAFNCFTGALTIYFVLPETKGKSVLEIQKMLKEY